MNLIKSTDWAQWQRQWLSALTYEKRIFGAIEDELRNRRTENTK